MKTLKKIIEFIVIINGSIFSGFLLSCLFMGVKGVICNRIIDYKGIIPMIMEWFK